MHRYTKRSKRIRRTISIISLVISLLLITLIGLKYFSSIFRTLNSPSLSATNNLSGLNRESSSLNETSSKSNMDLSSDSESYLLMDPSTDQILKSYNTEVQRAPASTTKLLTGLIAIKTLKETDIVKVGPEVNLDGSKLGLNPGDEISVHDLLTALYVHSANDAAAALAVKVGGSVPAFAEEMNNYAADLGCKNSHFTNPHGLPDPDHYTTAADLSVIAREFINNQQLMSFVKQTHASVQWKDSNRKLHYANLQNTNSLLEVYPGDRGLKTGTTTEAGQCLVSYVSRPDGDLLLVLLGSKQRYKDSIALLDEGWSINRSSAALKNLATDPQSLLSSPGIFN